MTKDTKKTRHTSNDTKELHSLLRKIEENLQQQKEQSHQINQQLLKGEKSKFFLALYKFLYIPYRETVSASGIIVLLVTFYLYQSNFLSINPSQSLISEEPLLVPFVIENRTLIGIKNIEINSYYNHVVTDLFDLKRGFLGKSHFIYFLKPQGRHTIFFDMKPLIDAKTKELKKADIQLNITYEALFFDKKFSENFRFISKKGEGGIYYYFPITDK